MPIAKPFEKTDVVCRQVYFPNDFIGEGGPLSLNKTMAFPSDGSYKESVDCKRLVVKYPTDVHARGLDRATKKSSERVSLGKPPLDYKGIVEAELIKIVSMNYEEHKFIIHHEEEASNKSHCTLEFLFPGKTPLKAIRARLLDDLYQLFGNLIPV